MELSNQDGAAPPDLNASSHPELPQASPGGAVLSPSRIPKKIQPGAVALAAATVEPTLSAPIELTLPPPPPISQPRSNSFDNNNNALGSLVLPDGVTLPPSVTPQMLDGRLRRSFLDLTPTQMREVLTEYDEAVREKGSEIRNRNAYLFGVVKRYKTILSNGGHSAIPQGNNLSTPVLSRLELLIASGFCTADELDMKIKDRMRMLPERDALDAIDEMNGCSRSEIRNFGSYFMGIMNRYMRGERQNPQNRGINRSRNNNREGNRFDDRNRGGSNDIRHSHYGNQGRNDRRDGREGRSSRDGDRDRYRRRRRSRSRSRSYDSRSRSRSPDYRRRRSRSDSQDGYRSRRRDDGRSSRDPRRSRDSNNSSSIRQNQPPMAHMLHPPPPPPPPPPRPQNISGMGMQPTMALGLPGQPHQLPGQPQMMPGQAQMPQPTQLQFLPLGQISQQPQLGQGPNAQQMQPFLQQQQQFLQQQFQQQPVPGSSMQQAKAQLQQQSAIQQMQMQQAKTPLQQQSAIQQMQNFSPNMSQQNAAALTNLLLGQGAQQPSAQAWSMQNQNQGAPMDILGLADKAAQALSGQVPQGGSNPNFPPSPAPAPAQSFQHLQQQQRQQSIYTEKDLPMMVQYAVQNLRTTGHIEQTLDGNLCAMLKRLPEHAALQALEIFSSCDLSKMRNRSSYLAGILKKELIKLGL